MHPKIFDNSRCLGPREEYPELGRGRPRKWATCQSMSKPEQNECGPASESSSVREVGDKGAGSDDAGGSKPAKPPADKQCPQPGGQVSRIAAEMRQRAPPRTAEERHEAAGHGCIMLTIIPGCVGRGSLRDRSAYRPLVLAGQSSIGSRASAEHKHPLRCLPLAAREFAGCERRSRRAHQGR